MNARHWWPTFWGMRLSVIIQHRSAPGSAFPNIGRKNGFASELRKNGVAVTISDPFMTVKVPRPNAMRICLGGAPDTPTAHHALIQIRHTMDQMPGVHAFDVMY